MPATRSRARMTAGRRRETMRRSSHAKRAFESEEGGALATAGLRAADISRWRESQPVVTGDYERDAEAFTRSWRLGAALLAALPAKPARTPPQAEAAATIHRVERAARDEFLNAHVE